MVRRWAAPSFVVLTLLLFAESTCELRIAGAQDGKPSRRPKKPAAKPAKIVPLNKKGTVMLDLKGKRVLLNAKVVLREGILEMFCCLKRTKEHESILAIDAKAFVVHTGLLAIGAKKGAPEKYRPKYRPPTGQEIAIYVIWKDRQGKLQRVSAQTWIRRAVRRYYTFPMKTLPDGIKMPDPQKSELKYDKQQGELFWFDHMTLKQRDGFLKLSPDKMFQKAIKQFHRRSQPRQMTAKWLFTGSAFVADAAGTKHYRADLPSVGTLICLANFPSAMIDVAVRSSAQVGHSLYEAYTERIPPKGTEVTIELIPVVKKTKKTKRDASKSKSLRRP